MTESVIPIKLDRLSQIDSLKQTNERFYGALIYLFDDCNMKCQFCAPNAEHNKHFVHYNKDQVLSYADDIKSILPLFYDPNNIDITIIGGELFVNKVDWNVYHQLFDQLNRVTNNRCHIQIISNFLFDHPEKVLDLIQKYNIKIDLSFDFVGRYTKQWMIPKVLENVRYLASHNITVNVITTMSKPSIDALINRGENYSAFISLYENPMCNIQLGEYIDMTDWLGYPDPFKVTSDDLVRLFKHLIEYYPQIKDVQQLKTNLTKKRLFEYRCGEIYISKDNIGYCTKDFLQRKQTVISNNNCFSCNHFKYCSLICYKSGYKFEYCWKKQIYDYLIKLGYG